MQEFRSTVACFALGFIATFLILALCFGTGCSGKGIVALPGWGEGVAFCESEYYTVVSLDEATVWNDGLATYVINTGHYRDEETRDLVKLATKHCSQLMQEK